MAFLVPHSRFQFKQQHFEVYEVYIINDVNMYALGNTKSSESMAGQDTWVSF